jgi:hypothetical protein
VQQRRRIAAPNQARRRTDFFLKRQDFARLSAASPSRVPRFGFSPSDASASDPLCGPVKMEANGIEPMTSGLQNRRSPS